MAMGDSFIFTTPIGGPNPDCYFRVTADSEDEARMAMIARHGRDGWASCYRLEAGDRVVEKYGLTEIGF